MPRVRPVARAITCLVACVAAWCIAGYAHADGEHLRRGMAAYDDLDYPTAAVELQAALDESLAPGERVTVLRTLGMARAALEQDEGAREAFEGWLRLEPGATFEAGVAPRMRELLDEARRRVLASPTPPVAIAAPPVVAEARRVPAPAQAPLYRRPWLWTAVGGATVAVVAGCLLWMAAQPTTGRLTILP